MTNDGEHGRSRRDAFIAIVRGLPEWAYITSVFAIGVIGGAIYLLAAGP